MCWLHVYAWLRVKLEVKGTGVRSVLSWRLYHSYVLATPGAPNDNFRENICSGDDLRSRIFGTFVVKFLASMPLLGFSNI